MLPNLLGLVLAGIGDPPDHNGKVIRSESCSHQIHQAAQERLDDGTVMVEFSDDMGLVRARATGLEDGSSVRHSYWIRPDDPLSAKVEAAWQFETRRGDWEVTTRSSSTMTADATRFFLTARLEAFENGAVVFDRVWNEVIERDGG